MIIGIDASRAFVSDRTGTENYSYHLVTHMLRLPESRAHIFVLFIRPNAFIPQELVGYSNVIIKTVKWRYLWTQIGLASATRMQYGSRGSGAVDLSLDKTERRLNGVTAKQHLDVLWVPAHTLPVLRNPRIRTVVTIHGLEYQWLPEYKNLLQRWYLPLSTKYAAKYADKLIAVSKFTAKQLEKELHTSSKKIKVVYEGVETINSLNHYTNEEMSNVIDKYGIKAKKYILFVGSIQPRKNLPDLIAAFARLSPELSDYKLVIAGGVGWMAEQVFGAAQNSRVSERIIFTGRVSQAELTELYRGAALYVQPSITEGFGLPILEAMAAGVAVVSSDGGALTEVVGDDGVIVGIGDDFVSRLRMAIERVIKDKKLQNNLITKGYKRVKEFTWQKAAKQSLKVLTG